MNKFKQKFKMRNVLMLLLICLVAGLYNSTTYSSYTSQIGGSGNIGIAKFYVSTNTNSALPISFSNLKPGDSASWNFAVNANSETVSSLKIKLEGTTNLPLTYSLTGDGLETDLDIFVNGEYVSVAIVSMGSVTKNYTLTASWSDLENNPDFAGLVDALELVVWVEQII